MPVQGHPVGGGVADRVPLLESSARGTNLLKVNHASVERDKYLTLAFKHAIGTTMRLKRMVIAATVSTLEQ